MDGDSDSDFDFWPTFATQQLLNLSYFMVVSETQEQKYPSIVLNLRKNISFFPQGLCTCIIGPTLLDLSEVYSIEASLAAKSVIAVAAGGIVGSMIGTC